MLKLSLMTHSVLGVALALVAVLVFTTTTTVDAWYGGGDNYYYYWYTLAPRGTWTGYYYYFANPRFDYCSWYGTCLLYTSPSPRDRG